MCRWGVQLRESRAQSCVKRKEVSKVYSVWTSPRRLEKCWYRWPQPRGRAREFVMSIDDSNDPSESFAACNKHNHEAAG